jgi:non-ribosomal peptide synthetase component E (peptide arylation enzyme)
LIDLLNAQRARVLVIPAKERDEACWQKADGILAEVPSLHHLLVAGGSAGEHASYQTLQEALTGCRDDSLDFKLIADRNAVCALFHTGGTTGRPKLVQLTHADPRGVRFRASVRL